MKFCGSAPSAVERLRAANNRRRDVVLVFVRAREMSGWRLAAQQVDRRWAFA
jgi:hypothetical protein